jgi:hypothetical protein
MRQRIQLNCCTPARYRGEYIDDHPTPTGVDGERSEPLHPRSVGMPSTWFRRRAHCRRNNGTARINRAELLKKLRSHLPPTIIQMGQLIAFLTAPSALFDPSCIC